VLRKLDIHNQHNLIVVAPTFDTLPWYGSHATDLRIRHQDYLVKVLVPLIDERYPTTKQANGRLLLGFSKSGWGAFVLIAMHPEVFGYAASWDAPLMMEAGNLGLFGTEPHFGTQEQFAKFLPVAVLADEAETLAKSKRLVLTGAKFFGKMGRPASHPADLPFCHTEAMHRFLTDRQIAHAYNPDLAVPHSWHAGWVKPTLEVLLELAAVDTMDEPRSSTP